MRTLFVLVFSFLSFNAFAGQPVISPIDGTQFDEIQYVGWAKVGDKEVVAAWYYNDADEATNPSACEVYYKPSAESDYYLQGWAMGKSPELCMEIADGIASNLVEAKSGTVHQDTAITLDAKDIFWGEDKNETTEALGLGGIFNPFLQ